ncbi:MAG: hypothetical protein AAGL24_05025 [Pseudomonadota bacterium]
MRIGDWPVKLQTVFMDRNMDWNVTYWTAREVGISNTTKLADILFYKAHPELWLPGGELRKLENGMANFGPLVDDWNKMKQLAESLSLGSPSSGKSKSWKPYEDSPYPKSNALASEIKDWLSKAPTHEREAALFISNREDSGTKLFFLAWKTNNAKKTCWTHYQHKDSILSGWFELKTSVAGLKEKHNLPTDIFSMLGNDASAKGISLMNQFVNIRMIKYVFLQGMCPKMAYSRAMREVREDGMKDIKNAVGILGIAGGAKPGSVKPGVSGANQAAQNLSKLNWKGFVKQIYKVNEGEFGRATTVHGICDTVPTDKTISGSKGNHVGYVRHFD